MSAVRDAQQLLKALVIERRAAIAADAKNPSERIRGGVAAIQSEIDAVEAALQDEIVRMEEKKRRDAAKKG